jgi:hypothetical protein
MITLSWGELIAGGIAFLTLIGTMIGTWRSIAKLKSDIITGIKSLVCAEIDMKIQPFISNQADVLRYTITRAHSDHMRNGYIDKYSLQALEALYRDYHCMNQNGFVDTLMLELRELPSVPLFDRRKVGAEAIL